MLSALKVNHYVDFLNIFSQSFQYPVYLLFDSGGYGKGYRRILSAMQMCESRSLFFETAEDEYQHLRPILFSIRDEVQKREVQILLEEINQTRTLENFMLIESDLKDVFSLQQHLKPFLDANLKSGRKVLVRFYDPRVFLKLRYIWQDEEQEKLWQHITRWHIYDDENDTALTLYYEKDAENGTE